RARGPALRARAPARSARGAPRDHRAGRLGGRAGGGGDGLRPQPPRRLARDLRPAQRLGLRAEGRHGGGGGRRGARRARPGPRGRHHVAVRRRRRPAAVSHRSCDVLIVGGGVAGVACAEGLRELGFDGSIVLAGREPLPPYERPPCSKGLLRGESTAEQAELHPPEWYAEREIELLLRTSVMKLDLDARAAALSTREEVSFGRALLATGANVRRLRVEGGDLDGIHYLRAPGNAEA